MEEVLNKIVAHKRQEVAQRIKEVPQKSLQLPARPTLSMRQSIEASPFGIIAEFKRRSPSKGWINEQADAAQVVGGYRLSGAAGASVLTDEAFFGGSLDDLRAARAATEAMPLLRKEFVVDPYQLYEARAAGADAVLLIAACLTVGQCAELAAVAHSLGLEVLLEIHTEAELGHLNPHIDMLGVNNRNLGTFHTDVENSFRLAEAMRHQVGAPLLVSESGLSDPKTVCALRAAGFRGFLMGETFMKTPDPAAALASFIQSMRLC